MSQKETVVVNLRSVPKELHTVMKMAAAKDDVSLELFIISTLTDAMQKRGAL